MTKKMMVSGVKVLALLLLVNLAVVQARQVLDNKDMEGCGTTAGPAAPLQVWTGTGNCGDGTTPCCVKPGGLVTAGSTPEDTNSCATIWTANPALSPISQQLSLVSGSEVPGLFDFQAIWACYGSGTCTLSLTITDGSTPRIITLSGATKPATSPGIYTSATATGISITNPNAVVTIDCDVDSGGAGCLLTQATLDFVSLVIGDPHLTGLDGQRFDTTGKPGSSYNLISDSDVQVNCLLNLQQVGPHSFISGPVMMIIAILTPSHTILANAGGHFKNDTGFISVDGVKVEEGEKVVTEDGVSVSFQIVNAKARDLGLGSDSNDHIAATCQIEIKGSYRFTVFYVENHFNALHPELPSTSRFFRRYLDLSVALLDDERAPHGILGQTHLRGEDKKRSIKDWKMEGTEDDYRLGDGVLGSDFAFNKFRV